MREAQDKITLTRAKAQNDMKCRDLKKLSACASLAGNAKRIGVSAAVVLIYDEDSDELDVYDLSGQMPVQRKRKLVDHAGRLDGEVDRFGALMKASDDSMIEIENPLLDLDLHRHE